ATIINKLRIVIYSEIRIVITSLLALWVLLCPLL
ncbi:MAG: hypothetical protein RIS77_1090, partial [Pseudomonadota bacterium]